MTRSHRVLLIDDEPSIRDLVVRQLATELPDIEVIPIGDPETQQQAIDAGDFDLVITDYQLAWSDGLTILREVKARYPTCPVIMFTGTGNEEVAVQAMQDGLEDYILKPNHLVRLTAAVRTALEHKQLREATRESLSHIQLQQLAILNNIPDIAWLKDSEGQFIAVNEALAKASGMPAEELVGKTDFDLVPRSLAEKYRADDEAVMRSGRRTTVQEPFSDKDGHTTWIETIKTPVYGPTGRLIGTAGIARDITERKQTEARLHLRTTALESAANGVVIADRAGTIIWVNPAMTALTTYRADELVGQNLRLFKSGEHDQAFYKKMWATVLAGQAWHGELINRRKDGTLYTEEMTITPVRDAANAISHFIAIKQDITSRKQSESADALWREIDKRVLHGEPMEDLLQFLCARLAEIFDASLVWIGLKEADGTIAYSASSERNGLTAPIFFQNQALRWDDASAGQNLPGLAISTGETRFSGLDDQRRFPWHERAKTFSLQAGISLPLRTQDQTLGALTLFTPHRDILAPQAVQRLEHVAGLVNTALAVATAQQQLRLQGAAMATAANAIFITDQNGRIQWVNEAFTRMSGYAPDDAVGQTPRLLKSGKQSLAYYQELWRTILAGHPWRSEIVERHKDGRHYTADQTITPLRNGRGQVTHFVAIHEDITAKEAAAARILHMAQHDALTDLPNRVLLRDRLQQMLPQARRRKLQVGLLFLDLDRFKLINDTFGHDVGDLLLKAVAERLRKCIREGDTVARLGGDEFTILLPDLHDAQDAVRVAEKILAAVAAPFHLEGLEAHSAASIGIVLYPSDAVDPDSLLKHADTAMYRAKQQGGNTYQFFTVEMQALVHARVAWEHTLRKALEQREFEVHYQPFFDLGTGAVTAIEALVRWRNPSGSLIMPAEFIPIAEETGLIISLGEWVLRRACADARALHDQGFPHLRLAVNVSARQFRQQSFIAQIAGVLQDTGFDFSALELELTESVFLHDIVATVTTLRKLKDLGIRLSIDDFGTGFSSLSYLKRIPIDTLKIDQSFVRGLACNPDDTAIVTAILALARTLHLHVIAEGVEEEFQRTFLHEQGCQEAQGYLFSRPLPAEEITAFLNGRAAS